MSSMHPTRETDTPVSAHSRPLLYDAQCRIVLGAGVVPESTFWWPISALEMVERAECALAELSEHDRVQFAVGAQEVRAEIAARSPDLGEVDRWLTKCYPTWRAVRR